MPALAHRFCAFGSELCNFPGQCAPILPPELSLYVRQKVSVVFRRIFFPLQCRAREIHVVRMRIHQCHPPPFSNPLQFRLPHINALLFHEYKQGKVLRQRVGQFDIPSSIAPPHDERKYRVDAVGLGFKGIRVEGRGIIFDIEIKDPFQIVQHGRGSEPYCIPLPQILVDQLCPLFEFLARMIVFPVVIQPMHADLKPVFHKVTPQVSRYTVPLGDKIKR